MSSPIAAQEYRVHRPWHLSATASAPIAFWLLISAIATIGVGKAILFDTLDPDLFWHLRVADQLETDGIGPIVDRLSYSSIKEPWTPYSWLAELLMKHLWDTFGYRAAIIGQALMVAALLGLVAKSCLDFAGEDRKLNCVVATALAAYLSIPFLSFRPITMALVLLAACAWLILRDRITRSWAIWIVVPLTALIANIHLVAIVVPIWIGCLLAGALWERNRAEIRLYAILLLAAALASIATPMLPGAIRTAWFYQSRDVMVASDIVAEMQPVWRGMMGTVTMLLVLGVFVSAWKNRHCLRMGEWLMLVAGLALMLRLGRFAPVFAMIAAPVLARTMPPLRDHVLGRPIVTIALACSVLLSLSRIALGFPWDQSMDEWMNRRGPALPGYPSQAATFVAHSVTPRTGRLINEFNSGGYLAWRLGDRYQVLLDGRTQLYSPQLWRATYLGSDADAANILRAANADAAIVPARKSRFRNILLEIGWQPVHTNKFAEVFLPPAQ